MKKRSWIKAFMLGVLAVAILLVGGSLYMGRIQRAVWDQSVENVLEVTSQGGHAFEVYLKQGRAMLGNRATLFSQISSRDLEEIGAKLDVFEEGDPDFVVIDMTHKVLHMNSQVSLPMTDAEVEECLSMPLTGVMVPFEGEHTGRQIVGYFERFVFADGAKGMVRKTAEVTKVAREFGLSFYDDAGFSYVIDTTGHIILRSENESADPNAENIFDILDAYEGNDDAAIEAFRQNVSAGKRGVMQMEVNGREYVLAFVPVAGTDGWSVVSVVPSDVIMASADRILMTTQMLMGVVVIALLVFAAFALVIFFSRRRVNAQQAEVLYRERLFNILANNTNDVFLMLSAEGTVVEYVSPNVERVLGVSREAVEKDLRQLQSIIHGEGQAFDVDRVVATPLGESLTAEGHYKHKISGEQRWFVETLYHSLVEGVERYIIVLADRTEDRQKEAALNEALEIAKVANESKSAFLSNMSHDIRTPMNAIVGLCTLLQRDADDGEKVRLHTRKITASSQHLLGLINDILDMSKIESGKTTLNISEFNLAELVDELATIIQSQTKAKQLDFDVVVQDVRNEDLVGDRLRISQVLINILSNAVKYTPEGGRVRFLVRQLGQVTQNIVRLRFTVSDTGIGMSPDYQKTIFQPFTRESRQAVSEIQGTGLGMAITKNLVDLMGGAITVESELGRGSTFIVELDLRIQEGEDDLSFWKDHGISNTLVVDDEAEVCSSVLTAMAGTGVAMQFALDGATAVSMTELANKEGKDFDLILLDWKMPDMDGLETARQIRSKVPSHIPIMILTAYDWQEIQEAGRKAGVDGFLSKPFFLSNFKEVIRSLDSKDAAPAMAPAGEGDLTGRHILCAEDNALNSEILAELLEMRGATFVMESDGKKALERFEAEPPETFDAILMDVQMPVMNGYDATRAIRALTGHPRAGSIPIVAMTANAFADDVRDALAAGMNAHVAKPIDLDKLVEVLGKLWDR